MKAGLVVHHFGSKEGLRRACDSYVIEDVQALQRVPAEAVDLLDGEYVVLPQVTDRGHENEPVLGLVGLVRVSTTKQETQRQHDALGGPGVQRM